MERETEAALAEYKSTYSFFNIKDMVFICTTWLIGIGVLQQEQEQNGEQESRSDFEWLSSAIVLEILFVTEALELFISLQGTKFMTSMMITISQLTIFTKKYFFQMYKNIIQYYKRKIKFLYLLLKVG